MELYDYVHTNEVYIQQKLNKIKYNLMYDATSPKFVIQKQYEDNTPYDWHEDFPESSEEEDSRVIKNNVDVETFKKALENLETSPNDFFKLFEEWSIQEGVIY